MRVKLIGVWRVMNKPITVSRVLRNRLLYFCIVVFCFTGAWAYGGNPAFLALYSLLFLPVISCAVTFAAVRGLKVTQSAESCRVIKNEPGQYTIGIHNRTPMMFSNIECKFIDGTFAVEANRGLKTIFARPFAKETHVVEFSVKYRGFYRLGLRALVIEDMLGLFKIKRKLKSAIAITVLPELIEIPYFPQLSNFSAQSLFNFKIHEEDYSAVSDVRKYEPTDPLKRVHWKLTAKKNEWMVKNFQTDAQGKVTVLTDTFKPSEVYAESAVLEDLLIETVLAVTNFCLRNAMPVEWPVRADVKREAADSGQFDSLFSMAEELVFEGTDEDASASVMLDNRISETAGYINAVIFTFRLTPEFCEKVINAERTGHNVTVLFIATEKPDNDTQNVIRRLAESGIGCARIGHISDLQRPES